MVIVIRIHKLPKLKNCRDVTRRIPHPHPPPSLQTLCTWRFKSYVTQKSALKRWAKGLVLHKVNICDKISQRFVVLLTKFPTFFLIILNLIVSLRRQVFRFHSLKLIINIDFSKWFNSDWAFDRLRPVSGFRETIPLQFLI